jgi:group I intron endonuclease
MLTYSRFLGYNKSAATGITVRHYGQAREALNTMSIPQKSGIYIIINLVNRHRYIGSASNFSKRWGSHVATLNKKEHENGHLQKAWLKYGRSNFEFIILEYCEKKDLLEHEQFYLDTMRPEYNMCPLARSPLGMKRSLESRAKMSAAQMGHTFNRGRVHTPEARANIKTAAQKRNPPTKEAREKTSIAMLAQWAIPENRERRIDASMGKTVSQENKNKKSAAMYAYYEKKRLQKEIKNG